MGLFSRSIHHFLGFGIPVLVGCVLAASVHAKPKPFSFNNQDCLGKSPMITWSDYLRSTWVYSYTTDRSMLEDPEKWLKSRLNAETARKNNIDLACSDYQKMKAALKSGDDDAYEEIAEESKYKMSELNAGHGLYFATNSITSRKFGPYLIAVAIPPRTKFGHYDTSFPDDQKKVLDLVFSNEKAIIYWWHQEPAIVVRDFSVLQRNLKFWTLDLSESTLKLPLHSLPRLPPGRPAPQQFLHHFRDFLLWASQIHTQLRLSKSKDLSGYKFELLEMQLRQKMGQFTSAAARSGLSSVYLDNIEFLISGKFIGEQKEWPLAMKFLADIGYLNSAAYSMITYGKIDLLQSKILEQLKSNGADKAVTQFLEGIIRLTPRQRGPWKYPSQN